MTDKKKARVQCPECGKEVADEQKLRVHIQYKHGKPANQVLTAAGMTGPAYAPSAAGADSVDELDLTDETAPTGGGPAIDPPGAAQLNTEPEPEPAGAGASPRAGKPEVHELSEKDERDYERAAASTMRSGDRILSKVLGVPSDQGELDDVIETMKPAATYYGRRIGPRFWLFIAIVGLISYVLGKTFMARQQKRAQVGAPGPLSSDGTASREVGQ